MGPARGGACGRRRRARLERVLDAVFQGKADLVGFVRRLFGYCATGDVREQIVPVCYGTGSNGKTLVLNAFMYVLGPDYAMKATRDLFMARKGDSHPTALADLHGKQFAACIETEEGGRLDETLVKELTGSDPIRARRMREDYWQFDPTHKCLLVTNHKPVIRGTDHGIWRRLVLVPFSARFWDPDKGETGPPSLKADKTLKDKLDAEAPGILASVVAGCMEWQRTGLRVPAEVVAATADYRAEQDLLGAFLQERCVSGAGLRVKASELSAAYEAWCKAEGIEKKGSREFGKAMTERGFERMTSNGTYYLGVKLRDADAPDYGVGRHGTNGSNGTTSGRDSNSAPHKEVILHAATIEAESNI